MTVNQIVKIKEAQQAELAAQSALKIAQQKLCEAEWAKYAEVLEELWPRLSLSPKKIDATSLKYGMHGARFGIRPSDGKVIYYCNAGVSGAGDVIYRDKVEFESRLMALLARHLDD
jgi:hypothetical protein